MRLRWVAGLFSRRTARTAAAVFGIALAVALFGSLGVFFSSSKARMTERATARVPVDWQVQVARDTSVSDALGTAAKAAGVRTARPVAFADTPAIRARIAGSEQTTGSGKVVGLPPDYAATFPGEIRVLLGSSHGVLLAQQTAANLHATVGSKVAIGRPGLGDATVVIAGIVDLPEADSFFQAVGVSAGSAPQAPPDNVVILDLETWHKLFDPVSVKRPDATWTQVHVDLSSALPPDPAAAFSLVTGRAQNLEAQLAGGGRVGDNLAVRLDKARTDALYAQLLFLFLGLPGALLAAMITAAVASAGRDRRRTEQALLRIRGAGPRRILSFAAAEAFATGAIGVAIGLVASIGIGRLWFGSARFGATTGQTLVWLTSAAVLGLILALAALLLPAWRDARTLTASKARAVVGRTTRPLWARLGLDVVLLAGAGLAYWQTVKSGYQVVLAPEGIPTISVSYQSLLAPLLLWIGAALLAWRIAVAALVRGRRALARATRPLARGLAVVVAGAMSRQHRLIARSFMLMALVASFAVSTAIFNSTYGAQARIDARLTNGADVAASTTASAGLPSGTLEKVRGLPGVADAELMQHRFAYVGNDLQDLYGIDAKTIGNATTMSNAYFQNGDAKATLATLAAKPDSVLVSDETVHDFQLRLGDQVRLRIQSADHAYHIIAFHYVGVAREFPTAPHDSFLIANASYVAQQTHLDAYQTLLIRTNASPPRVASEVRRAIGPGMGVTVQDVVSQFKLTLSGLTAIDLGGLTRLELAFAFVLAAAAAGLVIGLGFVERRRTFAIASALGAKTKQLAGFVWSEIGFVASGGLFLGALTGWGLAYILVKTLTGVFDPPPEHLTVPFVYLAALLVATVASLLGAGLAGLNAARRAPIEVLRDL